MSAVYDTGTISVTNGSAVVTGAGTAWVGVLRAGWLIKLPNGEMGVINQVVSATELLLLEFYTGTTQSAQSYWAIATGGVAAALATAVEERNADVQAMLDGPGSGKFADGTLAQPGIAFTADQDTGLRRVSSNKVALTTGGVDRVLFGADGITGPAVQSSPIDTTAGRLMAVGAFGLGADTPSEITDFTAALRPGFYRYAEATATGAPGTGLAFQGMAIVSRAITGATAIIAMRQTSTVSSQRLFFGTRTGETGAITWRNTWHDGNAEIATNANGKYIKFPNGKLICHHAVNAGSILASGTGTRDDPYQSATFNWTYPAAFSAAPDVTLVAESQSSSFNLRVLGANYFTRSATQLASVRAFAGTSINAARDVTVMMRAIGQAA